MFAIDTFLAYHITRVRESHDRWLLAPGPSRSRRFLPLLHPSGSGSHPFPTAMRRISMPRSPRHAWRAKFAGCDMPALEWGTVIEPFCSARILDQADELAVLENQDTGKPMTLVPQLTYHYYLRPCEKALTLFAAFSLRLSWRPHLRSGERRRPSRLLPGLARHCGSSLDERGLPKLDGGSRDCGGHRALQNPAVWFQSSGAALGRRSVVGREIILF